MDGSTSKGSVMDRQNTIREQGQVLLLFTLMLAALLGFTAIAIDAGLAYQEKASDQTAADAAALAAANVVAGGGTESTAQAQADEYAAGNEVDEDSSVVVHVPPEEGEYAGNSTCAEVEIESESPALFSRVLNFDVFPVGTRAVACGESGVGGNYAIISLNQTACQSTATVGTIDITVLNGGTWTNSTCASEALYANGDVTINTTVNQVRGGCSTGSATITPPCTHPNQYLTDPLAGLPVPVPPMTPVRSCPANGNRTLEPGYYNCQIRPGGSSNFTFLPGDYYITGGIRLNGSVTATFGAGTYTVGGNGFWVTGGADISGTGVTFYVDQGSIDMSGTADLDLFAPTSGVYEGVLFFQRRDNTAGVRIHGNAANGNWGTVYAAGATVTYQGTASTNFQFIVDKFTTGGTTDTTITFDDNFEVEGDPSYKLVE
jgi:Flp pilus assembly protein TadG